MGVIDMRALKCQSCGGVLENVSAGQRMVVCRYCRATNDLSSSGGASLDSLIKRGDLLLEHGEFVKALETFELALNMEPENPHLYVKALMAVLYCKKEEDLANSTVALQHKSYYKKAMRFGDDELRERLERYNEASERNDHERRLRAANKRREARGVANANRPSQQVEAQDVGRAIETIGKVLVGGLAAAATNMPQIDEKQRQKQARRKKRRRGRRMAQFTIIALIAGALFLHWQVRNQAYDQFTEVFRIIDFFDDATGNSQIFVSNHPIGNQVSRLLNSVDGSSSPVADRTFVGLERQANRAEPNHVTYRIDNPPITGRSGHVDFFFDRRQDYLLDGLKINGIRTFDGIELMDKEVVGAYFAARYNTDIEVSEEFSGSVIFSFEDEGIQFKISDLDAPRAYAVIHVRRIGSDLFR